MRGRVETKPFDVDLELERPHGARRIESVGGLRQATARIDDSVCPELLPDVT
jgi:hypothetical protein